MNQKLKLENKDLPVYLDYNATTPMDPAVLDSMLPYMGQFFGNASSIHHTFGWDASRAIETAREQVATLLGGQAEQFIFTSGATESNVMTILGVAELQQKKRHLITSQTEHKCVLNACRKLEKKGFQVTYLPPQKDGRILVSDIASALTDDTFLVSIMYANNEIGSINPIPEIGELLKDRDVLFHVDAAQAVGKIAIDVMRDQLDFLSLSGHKIYGPKGVGALYLRSGVTLSPQVEGGGQEGGLRGGTHNVPGIVGLGMACGILRDKQDGEVEQLQSFSRQFLSQLIENLEGVHLNGPIQERLPGNISLSFEDIQGDQLFDRLKHDIAISSGSACNGGADSTSHVLQSIGLSDALSSATIRVGFGRFTNAAEVKYAASQIIRAVKHCRISGRTKTLKSPSPHTGSESVKLYPIQGLGEIDQLPQHESPKEMTVKAIGVVQNNIHLPEYIHWGDVKSTIRVNDEYLGALKSVEEYSHLMIVYWMDQADTCKLEHVPQSKYESVPSVGMFACRCPYRPNPIAVTAVKLIEVTENGIVVKGLDAINNTPIIDIKPYTPQMDMAQGPVKVPEWVDQLTY